MRVAAGLVLIFALFASVTLLAGCNEPPETAGGLQQWTKVAIELYRVDDKDRSVTCYVRGSTGLSCVGMLPGDEQ